MINIKLRILRGLLEESIKNIDAGNRGGRSGGSRSDMRRGGGGGRYSRY